MKCLKLLPSEWNDYAEKAHLICFNEIRSYEVSRYDFVIVGIYEDSPCGYMTFRELDNESVYLGFGGAFPCITKSAIVPTYFNHVLKNEVSQYKNIYTYVDNQNIPMLKMALKFGFRIIGIKNFKNIIYVELVRHSDYTIGR